MNMNSAPEVNVNISTLAVEPDKELYVNVSMDFPQPADQVSLLLSEALAEAISAASAELDNPDDLMVYLGITNPLATLLIGLSPDVYRALLDATPPAPAPGLTSGLKQAGLDEADIAYIILEGETKSAAHLALVAAYAFEQTDLAWPALVERVKEAAAEVGDELTEAEMTYLPVVLGNSRIRARMNRIDSGQWQDDCACMGCQLRRLLQGELDPQEARENYSEALREEREKWGKEALVYAGGELGVKVVRGAAQA